MFKCRDEQPKQPHKVVDVLETFSNKTICVTLVRYNVDNPKNSFLKSKFLQERRAKVILNKVDVL